MNRLQAGLSKNLGSVLGTGGYALSLNLNRHQALLNSNPKIAGGLNNGLQVTDHVSLSSSEVKNELCVLPPCMHS